MVGRARLMREGREGMKVLVACEFSGVVRDAFLAEGHDAISCDLLPTESPGPHIQGDVRPLLREPWDLVIAHPPCQKLSAARGQIDWEEVGQAIALFLQCQHANAERVAVENPLPFRYVRQFVGEPDCTVHPYHFADMYLKRTCLWLQGLAPLLPLLHAPSTTDIPMMINRGTHGGHRRTGTVRNAKERARFHPGMAAAMARQWGN